MLRLFEWLKVFRHSPNVIYVVYVVYHVKRTVGITSGFRHVLFKTDISKRKGIKWRICRGHQNTESF